MIERIPKPRRSSPAGAPRQSCRQRSCRRHIPLVATLLGALALTIWAVSTPAEKFEGKGQEPWEALRIIALAQEEFLKRDGDHNGKIDYWRRDVAGLTRMLGVKGISGRLWGRAISAADERPVTIAEADLRPSALNGYFFRAIRHADEAQQSRYAFEEADVEFHRRLFDGFEKESKRMMERGMFLPGYEACLKCSHSFNILDARGAVGVAERAAYIQRVRGLACEAARLYLADRERLDFPLSRKEPGASFGMGKNS